MTKNSVVKSFGVQSMTAIQQALGDDISKKSYNHLVKLYLSARKALKDVYVYVHRNLEKEPSLTDAECEFMIRSRDLEEFLRLRVVRFFSSPPAVRARVNLISCPLLYVDDAGSADPKHKPISWSELHLDLDGADIHRSQGITLMCQDAGVQLIYLPASWLGLSPIEPCILLIKQDLHWNCALVNNPDPASMI
ncbi:hypothetical protein MJO28_016327 [Puccinia striiformis f. sp. tritici]|uniref:Uncharacterized protein n=1 Tax=Puccinia striiformis f. sp. tritici TaxID=168172 RepID=A0ACC0DNT0_9BASI|nr:hypothetical protein MJO28_016327 [Puccinia striiformis f. sp. tritici]